jgi:nucleoside-diphosphate-sugar epimerase
LHVLVIGGTRFIGPAVVSRLHNAGHSVTIFYRGQSHMDEIPDLPHLHGDRERLADFRDAFARIAPDVVLDMAPATEADALTVRSTFMGLARRIVAISSCDVYRAFGVLNRTENEAPDPSPITEDAPLRRNLYPHRHDDAPSLGDARRWKQEYDKILVERDDRAQGRVYNVAEPDAPTEAEWVAAIGRAAGWDGEVIAVPPDELPVQQRTTMNTAQPFFLDTTRIRQELGYHEEVERHDALRETVAWEREHPPA